jgi:hypothetical protein
MPLGGGSEATSARIPVRVADGMKIATPSMEKNAGCADRKPAWCNSSARACWRKSEGTNVSSSGIAIPERANR